MNWKDLIFHSAIATAAVGLSSKPIDDLVEKTNLNLENKVLAKTVAKTGVLGVFMEDVITEGLRNGGEKYSFVERLGSRAITAGALMAAAYTVSKYMKPRVNHNTNNKSEVTEKDDYKIT